MIVTDHAVQRYRERVEDVPAEVARAELESHGSAVEIAPRNSGGTVVLGNGARLKLKGKIVMTVVGKRGR